MTVSVGVEEDCTRVGGGNERGKDTSIPVRVTEKHNRIQSGIFADVGRRGEGGRGDSGRHGRGECGRPGSGWQRDDSVTDRRPLSVDQQLS